MKRFAWIMSIFVVLGVILFSLSIPSDALAACPGAGCRAYSVAYRNDASNYTAVHAYISYAIPSIRDGGFTSEVIWIGDLFSAPVKNVIEIGWRRTNGANPRQYWGYFNNSGTWFGPYWIADNTSGHDYQIEHQTSDNMWHIYIDGVEKAKISLGVSSGIIEAGGEVTDYSSTQHNAMGVSSFSNLSYKRNHAGYYAWPGWSGVIVNYSYVFSSLSSTSFQNSGYNP